MTPGPVTGKPGQAVGGRPGQVWPVCRPGSVGTEVVSSWCVPVALNQVLKSQDYASI